MMSSSLASLEEATGLAFSFIIGRTGDKSKMLELRKELEEYDDFVILDIEASVQNVSACMAVIYINQLATEIPEGSWCCSLRTFWICGEVGALKCTQCEHRYHEACLKNKDMKRGVTTDTWFCGEGCLEVHSGLQSWIGILNHISDGYSWALLMCIHGDQKIHSAPRFVALNTECNVKLAVALTIMEKCFLQMVDPRTGIDMIPHVLYNWGENLSDSVKIGICTSKLSWILHIGLGDRRCVNLCIVNKDPWSNSSGDAPCYNLQQISSPGNV